MAKKFGNMCKLTQKRQDEIAHAIVEQLIASRFQFRPAKQYRQSIRREAKSLGHGITVEELHQFLLSKMPKLVGVTFGWKKCSITGSSSS